MNFLKCNRRGTEAQRTAKALLSSSVSVCLCGCISSVEGKP